MLDHAVELARGRTRTDLDTDRLLNLALVRLLEIVGEAANRVPKEEQTQYPRVPWPQIVGLRNRLIHGYDSISHRSSSNSRRFWRPRASHDLRRSRPRD
jgi:uncharacterized protein with HEPN domain